jgi:hypothetical protein
MPCSDSRVDQGGNKKRLDAATRAACDLARVLKAVSHFSQLSYIINLLDDTTQEWIKEHEELDKKRGAS